MGFFGGPIIFRWVGVLMDKSIVFPLIAAMSAICSILFAYIGYSKGAQKESKADGAQDGELKANTEYIKKRIDDVLLEQRDLNRTVNSHAERLTRVEESSKQAHKRLDRLERSEEQ